MFRLVQMTAAVIVAALLSVATASAQGTGAAQDGFVSVPAGQVGQETLPAAPLVLAAYAFVWVALVVYVLLLWRKLAGVERELLDVTARIEGRRR